MFSLVFAESIQTHFSGKATMRAYRVYLATIALVILLWWPVNHWSYFIQFGSRPATFALALFTSFGGMLYFALRNPRADSRVASDAERWIRHAGIAPLAFYAGTMLFSLFYLLFLAALSFPLVLTSLAVSGADLSTCLTAGLIAAMFAFTIRVCHQTTLVALPNRGGVRFLIVAAVLLFFFLFSVRGMPYANPVISLQSIIAGENASSLVSPEFGTVRFRRQSIRSGAVSVTVVSVVYAATLIVAARRFGRTK